ncbi:PadR family transcriptional regulator [Arthrobacter sp. H5]|uniref:PadR family transcriptional regulator n=1 Tax=Arthrobacter sp. H5 TaxID=1267973 RepID=UPI00047FBF8A|nr:PadR family transcriptional regulator [Arthrobacter sp. H5]
MPTVFAHGALRLYLLSLLDGGPKHGYEIIKALSDRFGGTYSPSAGTIYPRLSKLEVEGLVSTATDGRRTRYSITVAGQAELKERQEDLAGIEEDIADSVRRLADDLRGDIRRNMQGLRAEMAASAESAQRTARRSTQTTDVLGHRAVKELEHLVNQFRDDVRMDLRRHTAGGNAGISDVTAETVRTVLHQAHVAIRATLGSRPD